MRQLLNLRMDTHYVQRRALRKDHGLKERSSSKKEIVLSISRVDIKPRAQRGKGVSIDL